MTEAEWLGCWDVLGLTLRLRGKTTARKRLLLGCACFRLYHQDDLNGRSDILPHPETIERYADGEAQEQAFAEATRSENFAGMMPFRPIGDWFRSPWGLVAGLRGPRWVPVFKEVFHPFPHPVPAVWLNWNDGTVQRLASAAYEERSLESGAIDPIRLAVLADALEEAGCEDAEILTHLRGPGPHVRGCWALDLVLGKS